MDIGEEIFYCSIVKRTMRSRETNRNAGKQWINKKRKACFASRVFMVRMYTEMLNRHYVSASTLTANQMFSVARNIPNSLTENGDTEWTY
jgi:hypothetical protein